VERPGWLRLRAVPQHATDARLWMQPNQLLQKLPAPAFTATTRLELPSNAAAMRAGLVLMGQNYTALLARRQPDGIALEVVNCTDASNGGAEAVAARALLPAGPVWLRAKIEPEGRCSLSASSDGTAFAPLGETFTLREGRWIGAKVGLVCIGSEGFADFDEFVVE
jgi:hypothetical protein